MKKLISVAALAAVVSLTTPAFADSTGVTMINRCNAQSEAGHSVSIETSSAAICKSSAHYFESLIPYNPGDWAVIYAWGFCLGMEGISEGIIGKTALGAKNEAKAIRLLNSVVDNSDNAELVEIARQKASLLEMNH